MWTSLSVLHCAFVHRSTKPAISNAIARARHIQNCVRDTHSQSLPSSRLYAIQSPPSFPLMASTRKCSHCGGNGHNSRTCAERAGVKLFGVRISDACGSMAAMHKSASTGKLADPAPPSTCDVRQDGFVSDGVIHITSKLRERKKGVPWTEQEHKLFLVALGKLGKGDWRGISKNFVKSRTPTQVASHAQKYFLRQSNLSKRRRRSSLFDMTRDAVSGNAAIRRSKSLHHPDTDVVKDKSLLEMVPIPPEGAADISYTPRNTSNEAKNHQTMKSGIPVHMTKGNTPVDGLFPGWRRQPHELDSALLFTYMWPQLQGFPCPARFPDTNSKIVKPIPIFPTTAINSDASAASSKPSVNLARPVIERTLLSCELSENVSRRHSAFHTLSSPELNSQGSLCNAISIA